MLPTAERAVGELHETGAPVRARGRRRASWELEVPCPHLTFWSAIAYRGPPTTPRVDPGRRRRRGPPLVATEWLGRPCRCSRASESWTSAPDGRRRHLPASRV